MIADKQQIIDLETRFWQSMKDKDVETAQSLIAARLPDHWTDGNDANRSGQICADDPRWQVDTENVRIA